MYKVSIGCDPEFDVAGFDFGEMADSCGLDFGLPFGFDGSAAELRPGCSYSVLELLSMIKGIMKEALNRNPFLRETRWVAGAVSVDGCPLGGHIHLGGLARAKNKIDFLVDKLDDILFDIYDPTFVPSSQRTDRRHMGYGHKHDYHSSGLLCYSADFKDFQEDTWEKDYSCMIPPSIKVDDDIEDRYYYESDVPPRLRGTEKLEYRAVSGGWLYSPTLAFLYLATAKLYGLLHVHNRKFPNVKDCDLKKAARVIRKTMKKERKLLGQDKDMRVLNSILRGVGKGRKPYKQIDRQDFKKKWGLV